MTSCAGWARCKDGTQFASFRTRTASPPSRTVNKQTNKTNINSSYLRYFVHAVKHRQCEYKSCLAERFMWLSSGLTFLLSRSLMESARHLVNIASVAYRRTWKNTSTNTWTGTNLWTENCATLKGIISPGEKNGDSKKTLNSLLIMLRCLTNRYSGPVTGYSDRHDETSDGLRSV